MAAWPTKRMDDLCEITSSKRIFAADYVSEGVPFYRGREITEKYKGNLDVSTELFITEEKFAAIERKFGAPILGDLLLTSVGTLGSVYVVKAGDRFYFKDGNLTWFRNFKGLDSNFLYYWIGSPQGKAELQKCTIGSSQSAFTIVLLKGIEIELPPVPVQQRIAVILSAYDELIENSQRRIKILESMARGLYREWFVHFRFPGHENHPRVASALGAIPEGWAVKEMQEIADVIDCLHSKKPAECEGGHGILLQLNNIGEGGKLDMREQFRVSAEDYRLWISRIELRFGDCVVTNVGRVGAVAQIPEGVVAAPGRNMTAIRARTGKLTPTYLIEYLLSPHMTSEVAKRKDLGTIMDSLNVKGIIRLQVPCPPYEVMQRFDEAVRPIRRRIELLVQQIQNLRRTRDLLLPRLLSGQIEVEAT